MDNIDWSRFIKDQVINFVLDNSITYLDSSALGDLYDQVERIENENISGIVLEAGCALGGSAIVIAAAKSAQRPFLVYDVFDMIPPPSEKDGQDVRNRYETIRSGKSQGIRGQKYYGYEDDLFEKVKDNFQAAGLSIEENSTQLIKGLFQETLYPAENVALAHIDGDWYQSVKVCLERIEPHLVSGSAIIIDDYYHWSGCRQAVDEHFRDRTSEYEFQQKSRLHIIKK